MLKNIISAVFVASITLATVSAMANNNPPAEKINVALASPQDFLMHDAKNPNSTITHADKNADNLATPAFGWVFGFALFSFVLLSNRRAI